VLIIREDEDSMFSDGTYSVMLCHTYFGWTNIWKCWLHFQPSTCLLDLQY